MLDIIKLIYTRIVSEFSRLYKGPIQAARDLGVRIGNNCRLVGRIDFGSEPYLISLGNHVSVTTSQFVTHDGGVWVFRESQPDVDLFKPISVGNNVFIGIGCIIMPGVIIGNNVIVGAGSVVTKSLESNAVYAGIPAKKIKGIEEYWNGIKEQVLHTKGLAPCEKEAFLKKYFFHS